MTHRHTSRGPTSVLGLAVAALVCGPVVHPLAAQAAAITPAAHRLAFNFEWLQAGIGALHRDAWPSGAASVRRGVSPHVELEGGWLRAARSQTTAQGAFVGAARPFVLVRHLTVSPGAAVLLGRAAATADSGGYEWWASRDAAPESIAYRARPRLSRGTTAALGASIAAEVPVWRGVAMRAAVRQWAFSGAVVSGDRYPTLAGVGVAVRPAAFRERHAEAGR